MKKVRRFGIAVGSLVALAAALPVPALAQSVTAPRTDSGLFGSSSPAANTRQRFNFLLVATEALDRDSQERVLAPLGPGTLQSDEYSTMLFASTDYRRGTGGTQFRASASSDFRYFASLREASVTSAGAAAGLTSQLSRHTGFLLNQTAAFAPISLYDLVPPATPPELGGTPPSATTYRIGERRLYSYGTRMALSHDAVAGGEVRATGQLRIDTQDEEVAPVPGATVYGGDFTYSREASRNSDVSVGYHVRRGDLSHGDRVTEQGVPIEVRYSRALSTSRRADFRLSLMPVRIDSIGSGREGSPIHREYTLSAAAGVTYPFRRTWRAIASLRRQLDFIYVSTNAEPVFSNGARVTLDGFVTRRAYLAVSSAYSDARSALPSRALKVEAYTADVQVRFALTRSIAVYGSYLHYIHESPSTADVTFFIPGRLERTGVRLGLVLWIPMIGR